MPYFVGRLEISFIRDIRAGVRIGRWHALPSSPFRKEKGVILKSNPPWRLIIVPYCALDTRGFVRYHIVRYAIATIATSRHYSADSKRLDMLSELLTPRYKNEMKCDRCDPVYSFPTIMTTARMKTVAMMMRTERTQWRSTAVSRDPRDNVQPPFSI